MELTSQAAEALAVLRQTRSELSYEVSEICHSSRWRLSVLYLGRSGERQRLGLLYSEDREALEELRRQLERS